MAKAWGGPAYIRLGRAEMDTIYDEDFEFEVGKGVQLRDGGDDFTIVAVGNMVKKALIASDRLKREGINARVIDLLTIKPFDEQLIKRHLRRLGGNCNG